MKICQRFDDLVKIILIGDSGVGKTSFLNRFCLGSFKHHIPSTVGIDYGQKVIKFGKRKVMIQLWDTAGQQKFKSITSSVYRSATAIILMFSVDNRQSFNSIAIWMKQISTFATDNIPILLIGNKADLVKKQVSEKEAEGLAEVYKLHLMMTSCQKNVNVDESVYMICRMIKKISQNHLKLNKQNIEKSHQWCYC